MPEKTKTRFAPAERAEQYQLETDSLVFANNIILNKIAEAVSTMLVILNQQRQIVFANKLFLDFLDLTNSNSIIGKRPGEAVNCIHAFAEEGGCGTSEFCRTCGAIGAILESQMGLKSEKECRIVTCSQDALDLRVTATPYTDENGEFTIFAVHDISHEKRREMLERVFFHDVLNSAGGISGLSSILQEVNDAGDIKTVAKTISRAANNMMDEIQTQRQIIAAERGDLEPVLAFSTAMTLLNDVVDLFSKHEIVKDKELVISENLDDISIYTDPVILRRILGNMVKNALEASPSKATVSISFQEKKDTILFSVHNNSWIKREVQLQLFKRSFSTKGAGRGIGTYSMKLLGEKYLKGKVWFQSSQEKGTTFFIAVPKNLDLK
ncbi:sensor histidine kinase [Mariniphaga sp.]|uniref:sensor histidine kinase n=1 Tax=Mariniphaga sp. TaxID=1954475 RepID=UPI00356A0556